MSLWKRPSPQIESDWTGSVDKARKSFSRHSGPWSYVWAHSSGERGAPERPGEISLCGDSTPNQTQRSGAETHPTASFNTTGGDVRKTTDTRELVDESPRAAATTDDRSQSGRQRWSNRPLADWAPSLKFCTSVYKMTVKADVKLGRHNSNQRGNTRRGQKRHNVPANLWNYRFVGCLNATFTDINEKDENSHYHSFVTEIWGHVLRTTISIC